MKVTLTRRLENQKQMLDTLKNNHNELIDLLNYGQDVPNFDAMDAAIFNAMQTLRSSIRSLEIDLAHLDDVMFVKTIS